MRAQRGDALPVPPEHGYGFLSCVRTTSSFPRIDVAVGGARNGRGSGEDFRVVARRPPTASTKAFGLEMPPIVLAQADQHHRVPPAPSLLQQMLRAVSGTKRKCSDPSL